MLHKVQRRSNDIVIAVHQGSGRRFEWHRVKLVQFCVGSVDSESNLFNNLHDLLALELGDMTHEQAIFEAEYVDVDNKFDRRSV